MDAVRRRHRLDHQGVGHPEILRRVQQWLCIRSLLPGSGPGSYRPRHQAPDAAPNRCSDDGYWLCPRPSTQPLDRLRSGRSLRLTLARYAPRAHGRTRLRQERLTHAEHAGITSSPSLALTYPETPLRARTSEPRGVDTPRQPDPCPDAADPGVTIPAAA